MTRMRLPPFMAAALLMVAAPTLAFAQAGPPNALQGFSQNRDQPVKIDAATLEVRDKNKTATFSGNVQVVQGDTTLRSRTLQVVYDSNDATGSTGGAMTSARPGPGGQSRIKRLEAKGGVTVLQKDQVATGDTGIFDMASNTVTLIGNVVIKQGENVLQGDQLVVDLTSGEAKFGPGKSGTGRVKALLQPSSVKDQKSEQKSGVPTGAQSSQRDLRREPARDTQRPKSTNPSGIY